MGQNNSNIQLAPSVTVVNRPSYLVGFFIGLLLAGLILGLIFYFFYNKTIYRAEVAKVDTFSFQSANINALKTEIDRYKNLLNEDVCADPSAAPGLFSSPKLDRPPHSVPPALGGAGALGQAPSVGSASGSPGATPGSPKDQAEPTQKNSSPPEPEPEPERVPEPEVYKPEQSSDDPQTIMDDIEEATVLVLAVGKVDISTGTGFFVSENLIMTNRHVVEDVLKARKNGKIMVTNKRLGHVQKAELVLVSQPDNFRDYAILKVKSPYKDGSPTLPPRKVLKISREAKRADRVSAWGYPGLLTKADPKMSELLNGNMSAAPELVYAEGVISVIQRIEGNLPLISHTADVSHGNSGGPLIDKNGEVIGINTFIRIDEKSNRQVNVALGGRDMLLFLAENNIRLD
ncbi:MAG: serine protease [Deltaproteobacteria bacterium]|jgi:S1-C subfamily serine protease|nr:serine protease [Deltaproteobacteria bacterium]